MITEIVRYEIPQIEIDNFINSYLEAIEILHTSEFCEAAELLQQHENPSLFQIVIRWQSAEAHIEGFRKSPEFTKFFNVVKPFFNNILEMQHYKSISR